MKCSDAKLAVAVLRIKQVNSMVYGYIQDGMFQIFVEHSETSRYTHASSYLFINDIVYFNVSI